MYPCVKFEMVKKAVEFYSKGLLQDHKRLIKTALELIQFGRKATVLTFDGKFYKFGRIEDR